MKLATSGTIDGIIKLISRYYYGSTIGLAKLTDTLWEVGNLKGKISGVQVRKAKGRYIFEDTEDTAKKNPFIKTYHIWIHHKYQGYVESAKSGEAVVSEITHELSKKIRFQIREARLEPTSYGGTIHFLGWND